MNQGITIELQFFMISILWGAIILLAYDQLRILRRIIRHNLWVVTIEDLIFWIMASVFIFVMIYEKNYGTIRGFSVMGMGIGMVLYHYIFSERIVWLISRGIQILLRPILLLIRWVKRVLHFLVGKIKMILCKMHMQLKNRMKSVKIFISNNKQKRKSKAKPKKKVKKKAKKPRAKQRKNMKNWRNTRMRLHKFLICEVSWWDVEIKMGQA